jgi:hypothetical protein
MNKVQSADGTTIAAEVLAPVLVEFFNSSAAIR